MSPKSRQRRKPPAPAPSRNGRRRARFRPTWHKVVGWSLIGLGVAVIVVNEVDVVDLELLPGGHSPAYLLLGLVVAVAGSWWLGLYDRQ
jgi:hypothetical protein